MIVESHNKDTEIESWVEEGGMIRITVQTRVLEKMGRNFKALDPHNRARDNGVRISGIKFEEIFNCFYYRVFFHLPAGRLF